MVAASGFGAVIVYGGEAMKGKHHIIIETGRIKYEFDIRRNITVIQGDSATGKTTLIDLLRLYSENQMDSGIHVQSDVPCVVFSGMENQWKLIIESIDGSIVFVDENYGFIHTKEFAETIQHTDNYYVLITRRPLMELPYSVQEIYGIRTTGKYHFPEKIFHEFYPIYQEMVWNSLKDTIILVEDSKAGFRFFESASEKVTCISAEGNANLYLLAKKLTVADNLIVIADGAAFGAFIERMVALAEIKGNVALYFPESFEWLILKSGLVDIPNLHRILEEPEKYIDSVRYFSWERFFTALLEKATQGDPVREYHKNHLPDYYLEGKNKVQILKELPDRIREELQ